jgi:hypothetical protein
VALERPGRLDSMRVGAVLKAPLSRSVPWYPKACSSATKAFEAALKAPRWLGEELASGLDGDPWSPEPTKYGADRRS